MQYNSIHVPEIDAVAMGNLRVVMAGCSGCVHSFN